MISVLRQPGQPDSSFSEEVAARSASLHSAHALGKKFLAVAVTDPREAAIWAVATFHSPLAFVPIPGNLPEETRITLLRQLPADEIIWPEELPAAATVGLIVKPLAQTWAVIFSSGSTGTPKGMALSGGALRASALAHAEHHGCGQVTWLLNLPLFHVGGLSVVSRAHFLGASVAIGGAKFSVEETSAWIDSGAIGGLSLVPTTLRRLLAAGLESHPALRLILLGGAPAPEDLLVEASRRNYPLHRTYGMTEHCSQIASERFVGSGLLPLPGVSIAIREGEILVRSPMLASGIYKNGKLESLPEQDGFFATGDLGRLENGIVELSGRKADLIISGGLNIFPAEIERLMGEVAGLEDFAVTGIPDMEWGEAVCLAVVGQVNPSAIGDFLRAKLDPRKVPRHIIPVPRIPRSPLGKIIRSELRSEIEKKILLPR